MSCQPFLILQVRGKKDVLAVRQKARLVAQLLCFAPLEQTCIAAGAFAVGAQALAQLGRSRMCFRIEQRQLHVFAEAPGEPAAAAPGQPLLRLVKELPAEKGLSELDVAWLVTSLDAATKGGLYEEVVKQNQEVLSLLHDVHGCGAVAATEDQPHNPSAA